MAQPGGGQQGGVHSPAAVGVHDPGTGHHEQRLFVADEVAGAADGLQGGRGHGRRALARGGGAPQGFAHAALELRDGKAVKETDYFAQPFPAPGWRAQWVERM